MATYYCDLDLDFSNGDGSDNGVNICTGVGGLQSIISGWGNCSTTQLDAGDELLIEGEGDVSRLVACTVGVDKSATWNIGNELTENGSGNWTGVLVYINATTLYVELDDSYDYSDVGATDVISNTTITDTVTMTDRDCDGILINANTGDTTTGSIKIIGVNSSWINDETLATLTGSDVAVHILELDGVADRFWFENLHIKSATSNGVEPSGTSSSHHMFINCKISDNGGFGIWAVLFAGTKYIRCSFYNNSRGVNNPQYQSFFGCLFYGNGSSGIESNSGCVYMGCLFFNNESHGVYVSGSYNNFINCIFDSNAGSGLSLAGLSSLVYGCRITNNNLYGITHSSANDTAAIEDYNVFYNNNSGSLNQIIAGLNSHGPSGGSHADPNDDVTATGYTTHTIEVNYDGGTNMDGSIVGETISKAAGWSGVIASTTGGATTGTLEISNITNGYVTNNDAFTITGAASASGDIDGDFSIQLSGDNSTCFEIASDGILRSAEIELIP